MTNTPLPSIAALCLLAVLPMAAHSQVTAPSAARSAGAAPGVTQGPAAARMGVQAGAPAREPAVRLPGAGEARTPALGGAVEPHGLDRVRALFSRTDLDHNGSIDGQEAMRLGVQRVEFARFDSDGSGAVDGAEFLVAYRALVAAAGQPVGPDLQAEATRIQAHRRALAAQSGRVDPARPKAARGEPARPIQDRTELLQAERLAAAALARVAARQGLPTDERLTAGDPARAQAVRLKAHADQQALEARLRAARRSSAGSTGQRPAASPGDRSRASAGSSPGTRPAQPRPIPQRPR